VMGKLGKKSLINWGSTNSVLNKITTSIFTKRNNMYFIALILTVILAVVFANKQEPILAHINKTTTLYSIKKDQTVTNNFILTIHNNKNKTYTYDIKLDDERFFVKRFATKEIKAGKEAKFILILASKNRLSLDTKKDSILKLNVTIYAKEDNSIAISRELSFIYPSDNSFK